MNSLRNEINLMGRVGSEPEQKSTLKGNVTLLSIATDYTYKKGDEWVSHTDWHNIEAWGSLGDRIFKQASKGSSIVLFGRVKDASYQREDGSWINRVVIVATKAIIDGKGSLNIVRLIGNVGSDPEVKKTNSGTSIATISLATTHSYLKGQEWVNDTDWHHVVFIGKLAKTISDKVKKGDELMVSGRMAYETFMTSDGNKKTTQRVIANQVRLLGTPLKNINVNEEELISSDEIDYDDLPF